MSDPSPSVLDAPNTTYLWTQLLVEELTRHGIETFFVSPGSRSTPLTVAAAQHPDADIVVHVDERGSAFAALGAGRARREPAVWITTSGTAVANGLPAVVEAAADDVPLLLVTSDRPPELRDTGANQTIDQVKIFGDYVRWQVDVPPPSEEVDPSYVLTTIDQAVHRAARAPAGPVHVNCMFRKPLHPAKEENTGTVPERVKRWARDTTPFNEYPRSLPTVAGSDLDRIAKAVEGHDQGVIVAGRLDSAAEVDAVRRLAVHLGWPLLPDITSRLRLGPSEGGPRVAYADLILTSDEFRDAHAPDAVLQVGGRFTSKRLRFFLRDAAPEPWVVVRPSPSRVDPDHRVTDHVEMAVPAAVDGLLARMGERPSDTTWSTDWRSAGTRVGEALDEYVSTEDRLTEPLCARLLSDLVPDDHALVVASSMPVRDLNRHAATTGAAIPVYANRGASGIDGTISTAAGVAESREGPVTLLAGDLAVWHDLNALSLLDDRSIVLVVINNDGGGIFHFLPIQEHEDVFDPYFTTPQGRTFKEAAATFDLPYHRPESPAAFKKIYPAVAEAGGSAVIEVQTDREQNRAVHDALESDIADAVQRRDSRTSHGSGAN